MKTTQDLVAQLQITVLMDTQLFQILRNRLIQIENLMNVVEETLKLEIKPKLLINILERKVNKYIWQNNRLWKKKTKK